MGGRPAIAGIWLAALVATSARPTHASTSTPACRATTPEAWQKLRSRFADPRHRAYLDAATGALVHAAREADAHRWLDFMGALTEALEKDDPTRLRAVGGLCGVTQTLLRGLQSKDSTTRGYAALVLGVMGNLKSISRLAPLLRDRDPNTRFATAIAVGLLGSREQAPRLVAMLSSPAEEDRSGAALGLAELGATEQAPSIAALLAHREEESVRRSAVVALVVLGAASRFTEAIARTMTEEDGDDSVTALYALAKIGAKPYANAMAKRLAIPGQAGDAAIALALLGASQQTPAIAALLRSDQSLVRKDATLALGILGATPYQDAVAAELTDPEDFVRLYAAISLLLMASETHRSDALAVVDVADRRGERLNIGDLHPLVRDRFADLELRLRLARGR
jgi:HEAT repeat protein